MQKFQQADATKDPEGYIEALVQVRNKHFDLIKDAFGYHPLMRTALDQVRQFAVMASILSPLRSVLTTGKCYYFS